MTTPPTILNLCLRGCVYWVIRTRTTTVVGLHEVVALMQLDMGVVETKDTKGKCEPRVSGDVDG